MHCRRDSESSESSESSKYECGVDCDDREDSTQQYNDVCYDDDEGENADQCNNYDNADQCNSDDVYQCNNECNVDIVRGPQGYQGITGQTGPTGPPGQAGPQGSPGQTDQRGPQGYQGDEGKVGQTGQAGQRGFQGYQGFEGKVGQIGPQGSEAKVGQYAPLSGAAFTGPISTPSLTATNLVGVRDNSNAAAGSIGEYLSNSFIGRVMTTGVVLNITNLVLTAGDWDVWGSFQVSCAGTMTVFSASISTTSATHNGNSTAFYQYNIPGWVPTGTNACPVGYLRISSSSAVTVYLTGQANFSSGATTGNGYLCARRAR